MTYERQSPAAPSTGQRDRAMNRKRGVTMKKLRYALLLAAGILLLSAGAGRPVFAAPASGYVHEESFSTDHELTGLFASGYETFQIGEDWDIKDAGLTLYYNATMLVREEISDFTVSLNGQPVYSAKVPLTAGETQKLEIPLPADCLQEGLNQLTVESYIRTNDEDPCKDDVSGASWMVLLKESFLSVSYQPREDCANVADVYRKLTSIEALENDKAGICLPAGASEAELTGAALALSGISGNAPLHYEKLQFNTVEQALPEQQYLLYISAFDGLLPELASQLTQEQKEAAKTGAVLCFLKGRNGQNVIVVTGSDAEAFLNACRLLGNQDSMLQTKAIWRKVSAGEDVTFRYDGQQSSQLTQTGSYVRGPFRQTAPFYIQTSADRKVAAGSSVTLKFRYAENLDFNRSLVTVYAGDVPLGSKKLTKEAAGGDTYTVSIPDNLEIAGNFTLNVSFDLELPDMECTLRRQDMPWAYVTKESTIDLRTEGIPYLLFDYFPSPFVSDGHLNQVAVILPMQETENDLAVFADLMLALGRYQKENTGELRVCRANNIGDLTRANVVSIGRLENNPIVQQINNQLYFQFSPKGTTIRPNEKMQLEPNYGATLGTAQLLYSPYSPEKYALLIISGVTDEGMLQASEYLGNVEKNWLLYGDGYVADREAVYCYRFGADNEKRAGFFTRISGQQDLLKLSLVGGCLLLLLVIAAVLLLRKYRKR